jgi:hypothetical protein
MRATTFILTLSISIIAAGCATSSDGQPEAAPSASAATKAADNVVEVCKPAGERQYLQRLRCPDGSAPTFARSGSGGSRTPYEEEDEKKVMEQMFREGPLAPGEPDYHVVDYYDVRCGATEIEVVMDMYHCNQDPPTQAPAGFTIEPPK